MLNDEILQPLRAGCGELMAANLILWTIQDPSGPADGGVQAFWDHLCRPRILDPTHVAPDHKLVDLKFTVHLVAFVDAGRFPSTGGTFVRMFCSMLGHCFQEADVVSPKHPTGRLEPRDRIVAFADHQFRRARACTKSRWVRGRACVWENEREGEVEEVGENGVKEREEGGSRSCSWKKIWSTRATCAVHSNLPRMLAAACSTNKSIKQHNLLPRQRPAHNDFSDTDMFNAPILRSASPVVQHVHLPSRLAPHD